MPGVSVLEDGRRDVLISSTGRNSMAFSKHFTSTTRRTFLKSAGVMSAAAVAGSFPIPAIAQAQEINVISAESNGKALEALKKIAEDFGKQAGTKVVINNM